MSAWERPGKSDEWHTPKYIFDAMAVTFDLDVASPQCGYSGTIQIDFAATEAVQR